MLCTHASMLWACFHRMVAPLELIHHTLGADSLDCSAHLSLANARACSYLDLDMPCQTCFYQDGTTLDERLLLALIDKYAELRDLINELLLQRT